GLINGDAVMGAAVWRNVFKASEEVRVEDVGLVVAYLRRELQRLAEMSDEELSEGRVTFGSPEGVRAVVGRQSPWMTRSFTAEDLKVPEVEKK
ncbi:Serine carboxypeptidase 3, partial [Teratosphaeriaceae sp. CCFEE 6253]